MCRKQTSLDMIFLHSKQNALVVLGAGSENRLICAKMLDAGSDVTTTQGAILPSPLSSCTAWASLGQPSVPAVVVSPPAVMTPAFLSSNNSNGGGLYLVSLPLALGTNIASVGQNNVTQFSPPQATSLASVPGAEYVQCTTYMCNIT